jgi:hypothetical protein
MPYGVPPEVWAHLPPDEQAAIAAAWEAAEAANPSSPTTPSPPPTPSPVPTPADTAPPSTADFTSDAFVPPGVVVPTGYLGASVVLVPVSWQPPPSSAIESPTQPTPASAVPPQSLDTDALVPHGVIVPKGYLGESVTLIPAPAVVPTEPVLPLTPDDDADSFVLEGSAPGLRSLAISASPKAHDPRPQKRPPQWRTNAGRAEYALAYLQHALKISRVAAAALVGNFAYESHDPRTGTRLLPTQGEIDHPDRGYGIAQWTNEYRKEALNRFADNDPLGRKVSDFGLQLDYAVHEIRTADKIYVALDGNKVFLVPDHAILSHLRALNNPRDLPRGAELVENGYESPQPGSTAERTRLAKMYLRGHFG